MAQIDEEKANDKAAEKLRGRIAARSAGDPIAPKQELPPGDVDVDLSDEEDDEPSEPGRPSRTERRAERGREREERLKALEAENQQHKQELERVRIEREVARQYEERTRQPQQQAFPEDVYLNNVQNRLRVLELEWDALPADQKTAANSQKYRQEAQQLVEQQQELVAGRLARRAGIIGQPQANPQAEAIKAQLNVRYPEVIGNPQAAAYMNAQYQALKAKGKPADWNTVEEAAQITRRDFGLSGHRAPPVSEARRSALAGSSRGGGSRTETSQTITVSSDDRKMAKALYPNMSEAEAVRKWASGPGKRAKEAREKRA